MVDSPISPVRRTRDSQFPAPKSRVVLDEFSVSLTRDQWLALCALAEPYATKDFRPRRGDRFQIVSTVAQSSMSLRRLAKRSERKYAASVLFPTACARQASATSRGALVSAAAQSRKVERNPCTVALHPNRRKHADIAMCDNGPLPFPNRYPLPVKPMIASAASVNG